MAGEQSGRIVGRRAELDAVATLIDSLARGRGGALIFEGEAGIGKSLLLGEAVTRAAAASLRVFEARAQDRDRTRPFHALAEAVGARAGSADPNLVAIARMLVDSDEGSDVGHRLHEALLAVIERSGLQQPTLLCVEDVHWADPGSVAVLRSVGRVLDELPIGLVLTSRPHPRSATVQAMLDELHAHSEIHRLAPLTDAEATELVGANGAAWNDRVGGNPFFLLEVAHAADDGPDDSALSAGLQATLLRRIRQLPPDVVELLQTAAVLGPGFALTELSAVTRRSAVDLAPIVSVALQAGFLVEAEEGLRFRHDLIREALELALPRTVAAALHLEAGWAMAATGADPMRVAPHLLAGAAEGDVEAIAWLGRAGHQAGRRSLGVGLELLESAIDLAASRPDLAAEIECGVITMLAWSGQQPEAIQRGEALLLRPLSGDVEVRLRLALAEAWAVTDGWAEAAAHADAGLACENVPPAVVAQLLAFRSAPPGADRGDIERARSIAFGPEGTLVAAATVAVIDAMVTLDDRRFVRAVAAAEEAVTLARRRAGAEDGDGRTNVVLLFALQLFAKALYLADRSRDALVVAAETRALAEALGADVLVKGLVFDLGMYASDAGRFDDALAEADTLDALGDPKSSDAVRLPTYVSMGDFDAADAAWSRLEHHSHVDVYVVYHRARSLVARGREDEAFALMTELWQEAKTGRTPWLSRTGGPLLIRLALKAGDRALASDVATYAERLATADAVDSLRSNADLCAAMLSGDVDLARRAVELVRTAHEPVPIALAVAELARIASAAGDATTARVASDEAVRIMEEIGADPVLLEPLPRTDEKAPSRRAPRPTFGWESLTPTELRVVAAVASGMSNPQIAEQLVVSRHTIESHMKHVFAKLGISSRVELAAEAVRREVAAVSP